MFAWRLVRITEYLNRAYEPLSLVTPHVDLDEGLTKFVVGNPDDDRASARTFHDGQPAGRVASDRAGPRGCR